MHLKLVFWCEITEKEGNWAPNLNVREEIFLSPLEKNYPWDKTLKRRGGGAYAPYAPRLDTHMYINK